MLTFLHSPPNTSSTPPTSSSSNDTTTLYTITRHESYRPNRFHSYIEPTRTVVGSCISGNAAYALAMARQIRAVEKHTCDEAPELRNIAHNTGRSLEERYNEMRRYLDRTDFFPDSEEIKYEVKIASIMSFEEFEDDDFVDNPQFHPNQRRRMY